MKSKRLYIELSVSLVLSVIYSYILRDSDLVMLLYKNIAIVFEYTKLKS